MSKPQSDNPISVLVVEDEEVIRMIAAVALADAGFEVTEAMHGEDALQTLRAQAQSIHAVFTDVNMPASKVNGVSLVHEASVCWPWINLIVTSGEAVPAARALPTRCRFLAKPYQLTQLVQHINELTVVQSERSPTNCA